MKLLFDQIISFRILNLIINDFPDSAQVKMLNLQNASDVQIWDYAKNNGYHIVSFDSDFIDISTLRGFPPKIIWLRTGNLITTRIAEKLLNQKDMLLQFDNDTESGSFEII